MQVLSRLFFFIAVTIGTSAAFMHFFSFSAAAAIEPPSQIYTVKKIRDLQQAFELIHKKTKYTGSQSILVVFDAENTLFTVKSCHYNSKILEGKKKTYYCPTTLTEKLLPRELKKIQNAGIATVALTSRGSHARFPTERELARHELFFDGKPFHLSHTVESSRYCPKPKIKKKNKQTYPIINPPIGNCDPIKEHHFINGVMYADGKDKGWTLTHLMKKLSIQFDTVIVIENQEQNIDLFKAAFSKQNKTKLLLLHYQSK